MRKTLLNAFVGAGIAAALLIAAPAAHSSSKKKTPTPAAEAASTKSESAAKTEKVNLNTADEKDIAAAKGVGAKLAKELVKGRPYKTWEDVSKVKGVGTGKKLDSLKKVLKLSEGVGAPAAHEEPAAETKTKAKKSKASSKGEEGSAAAAGAGSAAGGAAASAGASGHASAPSSPSSPSQKSSSSSKLAPGTKININTASVEELEKLPEIGPVKAQAIVDYRKQNGPFKSPEDIEKVKGIKEGTFAKIRDYIVVR